MFTSCEQNITLKRVLNQNHVENTIQQPAKKLNCIRKLHNFTTVQSLYFIVGNTWTNTFWVGIISLILSSIVKKIISLTETHISGLQNCNISVTKKMTPLIGKQFDCSNSIPCTHTHHEVASTSISHLNHDEIENHRFRIEYIRNETEIYQYSKKVSTQGLIGQVGGIHGITLGWSIWNPYFERAVELLNTIMHICNSAK